MKILSEKAGYIVGIVGLISIIVTTIGSFYINQYKNKELYNNFNSFKNNTSINVQEFQKTINDINFEIKKLNEKTKNNNELSQKITELNTKLESIQENNKELSKDIDQVNKRIDKMLEILLNN
ncbi:MAG: coiled-coil domain-containing protein [bacterium]